jgi:hypothetical protein
MYISTAARLAVRIRGHSLHTPAFNELGTEAIPRQVLWRRHRAVSAVDIIAQSIYTDPCGACQAREVLSTRESPSSSGPGGR